MKKNWFIVCVLVIMASCMKTNDAGNAGGERPQMPDDPDLEIVLNDMYALMDDLFGPDTRAVSGRSVASISPVGLTAGTRSGGETDQPLMYVVNFESGAGFAVISTYPGMDDILAITERGWLDPQKLDEAIARRIQEDGAENTRCAEQCDSEDDIPDDPEDWDYGSEGEPLAMVPAPFTGVNTMSGYSASGMPGPDDGSDFIVAMLAGGIEKGDGPIRFRPNNVDDPVGGGITPVRWGEWESVGGVPPLIRTKWDQREPFYNNCYTKDGRQAVAGCVAIAIGQIGAYHRVSSVGDWNWDVISEYRVFDAGTGRFIEPDDSHEDIARYIRSIGGYVNTSYGTEASGATIGAAKRCLRNKFGYDHVGKHKYDFDRVQGRLDRRIPVYMRGKSSGGGHAFVLDGYMFRRRNAINSSQTETQYLLHINWGWRGGLHDGYYNAGVFDPSKRILVDAESGDGNEVSGSSAFTKNLKTLTWSNPN